MQAIINEVIQQIDFEDSISCSAVEVLMEAGPGCLDLTPGELEKFCGSDKGKCKVNKATTEESAIQSECLTTNAQIQVLYQITYINLIYLTC